MPRPVRAPKPKPAADANVDQVASHQRYLAAKTYVAAPFRDARLFREHFTPKGRIPEQPRISRADLATIRAAARKTHVRWSQIAAVTWLDSRWRDPSAGGTTATRLDARSWKRFGTDGDKNGKITRTSSADQIWTVARYLATAKRSNATSLRSYFKGENEKALTRRATFLADYFEALGPQALEKGLDDPTVRQSIQDRILADKRVEIYESGRSDIEAGIIDPRVLVTLEFLANRFHTVTVSCLVSGHNVFTTSGNVSLHAYGQAVDIAALDGESVFGHQQKGGRTHAALKQVLLLPESMQPKELISLWALGGPSFALADHDDHIHIGFAVEADGSNSSTSTSFDPATSPLDAAEG